MASTLRVGIIGASIDRGWAKESHIPTIRKLAGLELAAVVTSSRDTADAAARVFGAKKAYGNAAEMFRGIGWWLDQLRRPAHQPLRLRGPWCGRLG